MKPSVYFKFDVLKNKIYRKELDVLSNVRTDDLEIDTYPYLTQIVNKDVLDVRKPFASSEYIYGDHPLHVEDMSKYVEDISFDMSNMFSTISKFQEAVGQVVSDTDIKYLYRGTKYLSNLFKSNFLKSRYEQQMLYFDNLQNVEKNKFDEVFFVDRSLGFLTKNVVDMSYYVPDVTQQTSLQQIINYSYYPSEANLDIELFLDFKKQVLINMLYLDAEFPGDQFLDSINYILYSNDGVNYFSADPYLIGYINTCFSSIYDQNSFAGFIPINTAFVRYMKIGLHKKTAGPDIVFNSLYGIKATFTEDLETAKIPVLYNIPYVSNSGVSATAYLQYNFNFADNYLIFENDGSITYTLSLSLDKVNLDAVLNNPTNPTIEFVRQNYMYYSPIIFDFSVFVGL